MPCFSIPGLNLAIILLLPILYGEIAWEYIGKPLIKNLFQTNEGAQ